MTDVPWWGALLLLILAAWRMWQLFAHDAILDGLRDRILGKHDAKDGPADSVRGFLECPYCSGFWIATGWSLAWAAWPVGTLCVALPLAVNAGLIVVESWLSRDL